MKQVHYTHTSSWDYGLHSASTIDSELNKENTMFELPEAKRLVS